VILNMVNDDDDPRARYKVYEGEDYATRAEARRTFWTALLYDPAFIAATMQGEPVVKRKALANMYLHTYFPTCCCRAGAPVPPARRAHVHR
jgi:hypothetical protein